MSALDPGSNQARRKGRSEAVTDGIVVTGRIGFDGWETNAAEHQQQIGRSKNGAEPCERNIPAYIKDRDCTSHEAARSGKAINDG